MKKIAALVLAVCAAAPALARTDVGVSIGIVEPGVYGRIDIGSVPPPALVYSQPVVIAPVSTVRYEPVYMYVPVEHQRHWARYCSRYHACARPVYFVRERWVRERWEHEHPGHHGRGHHPH